MTKNVYSQNGEKHIVPINSICVQSTKDLWLTDRQTDTQTGRQPNRPKETDSQQTVRLTDR